MSGCCAFYDGDDVLLDMTLGLLFSVLLDLSWECRGDKRTPFFVRLIEGGQFTEEVTSRINRDLGWGNTNLAKLASTMHYSISIGRSSELVWVDENTLDMLIAAAV